MLVTAWRTQGFYGNPATEQTSSSLSPEGGRREGAIQWGRGGSYEPVKLDKKASFIYITIAAGGPSYPARRCTNSVRDSPCPREPRT